MQEQVLEYASGNEIAAIAIKQIGYDLMGYYPITPSTQIAENLDIMRANGDGSCRGRAQRSRYLLRSVGSRRACGQCHQC